MALGTSLVVVIGIAVTAIWSVVDYGRPNYVTLHKWFRLFLRFALAAQMFYYGMAKVIPTQFPRPSLVTLVEPVGNLSVTDLLWTSIGASVGYQMFTGWAEMLAGVLLVIPQTTTLGALICLADMTQVFVINMTYDFGLKQNIVRRFQAAGCRVLRFPSDAPPEAWAWPTSASSAPSSIAARFHVQTTAVTTGVISPPPAADAPRHGATCAARRNGRAPFGPAGLPVSGPTTTT